MRRDPEFQNIPIRTPAGDAIRNIFQPDCRVFVNLDYSAIELRVAELARTNQFHWTISQRSSEAH